MKLRNAMEIKEDTKQESPILFSEDNFKGGFERGKNNLWFENRQEVIRHIKQMKKDIPEGQNPQEIKDIIIAMNGIINWNKRFFNITEEDLRDDEKDYEDFKYDGEFALFKDGTKIKMFTKCGSVTKAWKKYALTKSKEQENYDSIVEAKIVD